MKSLFLFIIALNCIVAQAHWETAIYAGDLWSYFEGNVEPPGDWKMIPFDDSSWKQGNGGIGYGDGDDTTIIGTTMSLYIRRSFEIVDKSKLILGVLHADYDDGFIAYLNGVEIARSDNLGNPGTFVPYNQGTGYDHEARMYAGGLPEIFVVNSSMLDEILVNGQNVLALQVHNVNITSSDFSSIFFLSFSISDSSTFFGTPPDWFFPPVNFESSHLPIVVIDTDGQNIVDDYKITAHLGVIDNGPGEMNNVSGPYNHYDGLIGIEIRGSSTQMFPKKQYAVETRDSTGENLNVPLLGMPVENDWILYAPYSDKSLIRNVLAYDLARKQGRYASRTRFCEVVINGDYKGLYVLMEKIKRDDNRVDIARLDPEETSGIDLTGGYIVKVDKWDGENNDGWQSPFQPGPYPLYYQYHYPKPDKITDEQREYIQDYIYDFESLMVSNDYNDPQEGYYQHIDMYSFVDIALISEISKNVDAYRLSAYMYKDIDTVDYRLKMGPVWDYNLAFGNANYDGAWDYAGWEIKTDGDGFIPFWWNRIWDDTVFRDVFNNRWNTLKENIFLEEYIMDAIDSMVTEIGNAQIRNFQRWPILDQYVWPNAYVGGTYENEINYLKEWILHRLAWINEQIPGNGGTIPDLVINEFLASNNSCCTDEHGDYDDFIEIYNFETDPVDIGGYYITDDLSSTTKWQIPYNNPDSTTIQPGGFLVLWADKESEQGVLHVEIKLKAEGEQIGLYMPDGITVVDTLTFDEQITDVSYGRYPDASDTWISANPTPGSSNTDALNINDEASVSDKYALYQNYPNPFNQVTNISYNLPEQSHVKICIYDMLGRLVRVLVNQTQDAGYRSVIWDARNDFGKPVNAGIYIYQIKAGNFVYSRNMLLLK